MLHQFVITIDNRVTPDFALSFLKSVKFIKDVKSKKVKSEVTIDEVSLMSERSLSEEWLSEEDNRWDKKL